MKLASVSHQLYAPIEPARMQTMGLLAEWCVVVGQLTPLVVMYADEHPLVQQKKVPFLLLGCGLF